MGCFISPDPIGHGDSLNLYAYVGNDPLNNRDSVGIRDGSSSDSANNGSDVVCVKGRRMGTNFKGLAKIVDFAGVPDILNLDLAGGSSDEIDEKKLCRFVPRFIGHADIYFAKFVLKSPNFISPSVKAVLIDGSAFCVGIIGASGTFEVGEGGVEFTTAPGFFAFGGNIGPGVGGSIFGGKTLTEICRE